MKLWEEDEQWHKVVTALQAPLEADDLWLHLSAGTLG